MSNRDGKGAKKNTKKKYGNPNTKCPKCKSTLHKCEQHGKDHTHHRFCQTCNYTNF